MFHALTSDFLVAPQIDEAAVAEAAARGLTTIVNNRPDGEEPSAPQGSAIAAACAAHGIDYVAIPVGHGGVGHPQIDALGDAIEASRGPVLAYCRSGTRSTHLWALARAKAGDDPQALCEAAAAQGYDLSGLRPTLDMLHAGRG